MKIRNKIIALMISLIAIPSFAVAKDGPYFGVKASDIKVDYKTVDTINLNQLFPTDFRAYDAHLGYNIGNGFFEFGYIKSNNESKNLGSTVYSGATISASTGMKFDGYRLGAGYNYQASKDFIIKPFINYYEIDITASGTITVTSGSTTVAIGTTAAGKDNMIDAGLGFDYLVNDRTKIGLSYARTLDSLADTNKVETWSINASYSF
jgi:hypothetical protein